MQITIIVASLTGDVPQSLRGQIASRADVELVVVKGVSPVSKARNEGLARATGDYVAWVDSDDDVTSDWLDAILSAISPSSTGHFSPDIITFDVRTEWHDGSKRPNYFQRHGTSDFVRSYLRGEIPGQLWCKVFKAELFKGHRFVGACYEDTRIVAEILRDCKRCGHVLSVVDIPKVLYVYKRRADGLSQLRRIGPTLRSLIGLTCLCWCWDMAIGLLRLWWDFAKWPLRWIVKRVRG